MGIDSSVYGMLQAPDILGAFQQGAAIAGGMKDRKMREQAAALEKQKYTDEQAAAQQKALAEKKAKEVQLLARSGRGIKDQAGYDSLLKTASYLGHDVSQLPQQWGPDAQGMISALASNEVGVDKQIDNESQAKQFDYTKEKDGRTFANQDRAFGLDQQQFNQQKLKNNRDYEMQLANMGLTREQFEEQKNQNAFGQDIKAKELALMERDKSAKQKYLDAKLASLQNKSKEDKMSPYDKKTVDTIASGNANISIIKNSIDSVMENFDSLPEDQQIVQARMLLKTLNSKEGKDAVGVEEVKRLGSLIEYKLFNLLEPGSFIGRDLPEFATQARNASKFMGEAINKNKAIADQAMGRTPAPQQPQAPAFSPDVVAYAQKHGISPDQANAIKQQRMSQMGSR